MHDDKDVNTKWILKNSPENRVCHEYQLAFFHRLSRLITYLSCNVLRVS